MDIAVTFLGYSVKIIIFTDCQFRRLNVVTVMLVKKQSKKRDSLIKTKTLHVVETSVIIIC
jgi:hypothetical protein